MCIYIYIYTYIHIYIYIYIYSLCTGGQAWPDSCHRGHHGADATMSLNQTDEPCS